MGYIPLTCAISGLPIPAEPRAPEPVVFWFLARNPYRGDDPVVFQTDHWTPVTWPLRGTFDGAVRAVPGPRADATLAAMSPFIAEDWRDRYEPVHRGATMEQLLEAEYRGRLRIRRIDWLKLAIDEVRELGVGCSDGGGPRDARRWVTGPILGAGIPVWEPGRSDGLRLTEVRGGCWEVSEADRTVTPRLVAARDALLGAGRRARIREDSAACMVELDAFAGEDPLRVRLAVARADAFNYMAALPVGAYGRVDDLPTVRAAAEREWAQAQGSGSERPGSTGDRWLTVASAAPVAVLRPEHYLNDMYRALPARDAREFLDDAAAFSRLSVVLGAAGKPWTPSDASGPQEPDWTLHVRMHDLLADLAKTARVRDDALGASDD